MDGGEQRSEWDACRALSFDCNCKRNQSKEERTEEHLRVCHAMSGRVSNPGGCDLKRVKLINLSSKLKYALSDSF